MGLTLEQQAAEIFRCKQDIVYFVETYCYVNTGNGYQLMLLVDNQKEMLRKFVNDHNVLVLGSRQTGKTTLMVCFCAWAMLFFPTISITFISRKEDQAKAQLVDIEIIFEHLPEFMRPTLSPNQATNKTVKETGSEIKIESVLTNPEGKGRGIRSHIVWVDEAAFLKTLRPLLVGLIPTTSQRFQMAKTYNLPYGIIMTTTPNGIGGYGKTFYDLWKDAEKDREQGTTDSAFKSFKIHWSDIPFYNELWYEEQKKMFKGTTREFYQEYDLAFLGGNESLLMDETIKNLASEIPIEKQGHLWIWEKFKLDEQYIISADVATLFGTAYSAVEVIKASDGTQVAEFRDKLNITHPDPNSYCLARVIADIVDLYPNATVSFENNGVGNELQTHLPHNNKVAAKLYKENPKALKFGVNLTEAKRQSLFNAVFSYVSENPKRVRSARAIAELVGLTMGAKGKVTKPSTQTDDTSLALGHAYMVRNNLYAMPSAQANVSTETDVSLQNILKMNIPSDTQKPQQSINLQQILMLAKQLNKR
jgi:hypothetical protein